MQIYNEKRGTSVFCNLAVFLRFFGGKNDIFREKMLSLQNKN